VVRGRQIGVVVDRDRVLAEAARRLDEDQQVAAPQGRQDDVAVRVPAAVHEHLTGRRAPVLLDGFPQFPGQTRVPAAVVGGGDAYGVAGELLLGEPVLVVAARLDQCPDQLVAVAGDQAGDVGLGAVRRAEVVALGTQAAQHCYGAGRGVEADGVADTGVLGGVRGQHERKPLVGGRDVPQPCVTYGDARDARGPLRVGDVGGQAVGVDLLEGERHGDQPPVELRHRDLAGRVKGRDTLVVALPLAARRGQAQGLDDGDVEPGERARVPGLVVAARRRLGRAGAAGGQDGRHDRVRAAQLLDQLGLGRAQGGDVQRHDPPAGLLDRVAQRPYERGVAAHVVGAVVEHGDHRGVRLGAGNDRSLQPSPRRRLRGRLEPVTGQQHRVGQEAGQLLQVGGTAVGEVGVRLGRDADRHGGGRHQLRVGCLFAREDDDGAAVGAQLVDPVLPGAYAAEQPYDHQVDALQQRGQLVEREAGGVGEAVADGAFGGTGAQEVGVGGGEQQDPTAVPVGALPVRALPVAGGSARVRAGLRAPVPGAAFAVRAVAVRIVAVRGVVL
jgi:hypothetical protein